MKAPNQITAGRPARVSARARTEAAAWVVCLHGPYRNADAEAACRKWLSENPEHATAFEAVTEIWENSARLRHKAHYRSSGSRLTPLRAAVGAVAAAIVATVATFFYLRTDVVTTGVGEQRTVILEDGSRIHLNTDTRVVPRFDEGTRRVELTRGEALFEVAKDPQRPFIVTAADRQVRALGTSFNVRREAHELEITLVEGKVTVSPATEQAAARRESSQKDSIALNSSVLLAPGQRLTIAQAKTPTLDTPSIERVTAWQRGQVALDNTPLEEAVAEMNRYSDTRLVVNDPQAGRIRISGIFKAGHQENFARAVALTYRLEIHVSDEAITLGRAVPP
jgi:transmembrane sensor